MKFKPIDFVITPFFMIIILCLSYFETIFLMKGIPFPSEFRGITSIIFLYFNMLFWTVVVLRIIRWIFPLKEGIYSLEQDHIMTWWKLEQFFCIFNLGLLYNAYFVPINLRGIFYLLLGAKIGKNVMIGGKIIDPRFVEIGDYTQLGEDSLIVGHSIEHGMIILKKVKVGNNVTIGVKATIFPGVEIGNDSILAAGAVIPKNTKIPRGEVWGGIPARKIKNIEGSVC